MDERIKLEKSIKNLIDSLKIITTEYGLGNSGNEYIVIIQMILYRFLNDKFIYGFKQKVTLSNNENIYDLINNLSDIEYKNVCNSLSNKIIFDKKDLFFNLVKNLNNSNFAQCVDDTLKNIADNNQHIFYLHNNDFKFSIINPIQNLIAGNSEKKDSFCKSIINTLTTFSFENYFYENQDFFSTIFEYLLRYYGTQGGSTYAEYYTPYSIAKIIANVLVSSQQKLNNITCYDPSAGSGSLLITLANKFGNESCKIFSQDISEKSSLMLVLNLVLNNFYSSINNVAVGNTLKEPYHKENNKIKQFDFVVSNPPFKLDFSNYSTDLKKDIYNRFSAGIPNTPKHKQEAMPIYLCFIQHVINSIKPNGKGAIVVPTGFLTAQSGIPLKIRQYLVDNKFLKGVVSMPSNIFANTGTNVSVVFMDKAGVNNPIFIDASKLGDEIKDGKNRKTVLKNADIEKIVSTFHEAKAVDEFSVLPTIDDIKSKNYSFSAGQYFEVKIEHIDITEEEFNQKIKEYTETLDALFAEGKELEESIKTALRSLKYE